MVTGRLVVGACQLARTNKPGCHKLHSGIVAWYWGSYTTNRGAAWAAKPMVPYYTAFTTVRCSKGLNYGLQLTTPYAMPPQGTCRCSGLATATCIRLGCQTTTLAPSRGALRRAHATASMGNCTPAAGQRNPYCKQKTTVPTYTSAVVNLGKLHCLAWLGIVGKLYISK